MTTDDAATTRLIRYIDLAGAPPERGQPLRSVPMSMAMMQVRVVRVPVHERGVPVTVRVGLAGRIGDGVLVLVMFVVTMPVLVLHWLVEVFVLMPLGQMQPQAEAH